MIGRTLSHYKILSEISRGGMGIVYRALDLKLDREVALNVLPTQLSGDAERAPSEGTSCVPQVRIVQELVQRHAGSMTIELKVEL